MKIMHTKWEDVHQDGRWLGGQALVLVVHVGMTVNDCKGRHTMTGGGSETRPKNMRVVYIMRIK